MRWLRASLIGVLTLAGLAALGVAVLRWVYLGPLPRVEIPAEAVHVECRLGFLGFYRACAFRLNQPYPSISVVEFVGRALEDKGWTRLAAAKGGWASDSWQRFVDGTSTPERVVNQYTASWQSPNGRHRADLGVRYYETTPEVPPGTASVALWIEPFFASRSLPWSSIL